MSTRTPAPALGADGWFTTDPPALLGQRCTSCGTYLFPPGAGLGCPNPECRGTEFDDVPLSRRGTIWSYTDAQYQPPPPYVVPDEEFEPFAIAAVQLAEEGLVVMGQLATGIGVADVAVGDEVEVVIEPLFADDEHEFVVWKWAPVAAGDRDGTVA